MFQCPHCEKPGIPTWRKAVLGPGFPAACKACGGLAGIGYPAWMVAMIPGSILMILALFVESDSMEWTLNGVGFGLMLLIPFLFVSLQKE